MSILRDRPPIAMIGAAIVVICLVAIGLYVIMNSSISRETGTLPVATPPDNASHNIPGQSTPIQNVTGPADGSYLNTWDGNGTRILLIDSGIRYGTFERNVNWPPTPGGYLAKIGDPCIIVNGTIRNDYDADYYIGLAANASNASGEKVGTIVNAGEMGAPWFMFTTIYAQSKDTGTFRIYIKYNGTDIKNYDIYAAFTPGPSPPP